MKALIERTDGKGLQERLRAIREQRRMTQEQFAETLDLSVDFLSLIERGRNAHPLRPSTGLPND